MPLKDLEKRRIYAAAYRKAHIEEVTAREIAYRTTNAATISLRRAIYRKNNAVKIAADLAAYRIEHRDELIAKNAIYRETRKTEKAKKDAEYRAENKEKIALRVAAHYQNNKIEIAARIAQYKKDHPEVPQASNARRRAAKANAPINDFTSAQWKALQEMFDHRCAYCGKRAKGHLTQDHITPLSKGGSHTLANIVPACRSCNARKQDKAVLIPVQPLLLLPPKSNQGT